METDWAHQIRERRLALRLTQQELADQAHVSRKTIAGLESPHPDNRVSLTVLTRVAGLLGLVMTLMPVVKPTLDDLLTQNTWEDGQETDRVRRRVRKPAGASENTPYPDDEGPDHAP